MSQDKKALGGFAAMGDPTRRAILRLLQRGERTAGDIASQFSMSAPSISHHLSVLAQAGLVRVRKEGPRLFYSLDTTVVEDLVSHLVDLIRPEKTHEK